MQTTTITDTTITATTTIATVQRGNRFDSRLGGHSYTQWTSGWDYQITLVDGRQFAYQTRAYERVAVTRQETPVEFQSKPQELSWEEVPVAVRTALFRELYPEGTEEEENLFVLGEVIGAEKNRINAWADAHQVHSRAITIRLREQLGEFKAVRFLQSYSRWAGTGYRNFVYIVDEKWQVTVAANTCAGGEFYDSYQVEDYQKILASQKAYGRRVARLAKAAGVPWKIAVFAGNLADDAEAVAVLKAVKAARGTADADLRWELSCGINRRCRAIEFLLGDTWQKLCCSGQSQTQTLAEYLLGEQE